MACTRKECHLGTLILISFSPPLPPFLFLFKLVYIDHSFILQFSMWYTGTIYDLAVHVNNMSRL